MVKTQTTPPTPPTLQAIAERVGVSRVAVGRVLLGTGAGRIRVADKTAARIRRVARTMGYQPNRMAQQLAGRSSQVIGVVIDSRSPSIFFSRLSAIEKLAAEQGYRLMVGQSHGDLDQLRGYCNDFASRGVDGVICITHRYPGYGHKVAELFARFRNVVFIGQPASDRADLNVVAIDTAAAIRNVVTHLAARGRRRIGLLLYSSGNYVMDLRRTGYLEGMAQVRLPVDEQLIVDIGPSHSFSPDAVTPAVDRLIDDLNADAVIATNDVIAIHVIKRLKERGLRVPDDIGVVGYDNTELAQLYEPAITSVDQQAGAVSAAAMQLLMKLVSGATLAPGEQQVVIEPTIVERETTRAVVRPA